MTVRRLVLLRHAKAANPPGAADLDRPLSARGHLDAQAAGAWLAAQPGPGLVPDLVLCSPSKRTRQTWHGVAANLPQAASPAVQYERPIYEGGAGDLLELVRAVDDSVTTVLMVGHNPSLSELAYELDPDRGMDSDGLRTGGLTVHTLAGSWSACGPGQAPVAASHTARGDR